jgi:hypothetical protein
LSIEKSIGTFDLICDSCGESPNENFDDFMEAVEYKKDNGWRSHKNGDGEWEDLCPDCYKERCGYRYGRD